MPTFGLMDVHETVVVITSVRIVVVTSSKMRIGCMDSCKIAMNKPGESKEGLLKGPFVWIVCAGRVAEVIVAVGVVAWFVVDNVCLVMRAVARGTDGLIRVFWPPVWTQ